MPETIKNVHRSPNSYPRDWRRPTSNAPRSLRTKLWENLGENCESVKTLVEPPKRPSINVSEQKKFEDLVFWWIKETSASSSLLKKVIHPAYQRIMAKGPSVIPLILKEMKRRPGHWFWALEYLTEGQNPAANSRTLT